MIVTIPFVANAYPYQALAEKIRTFGPYSSHALHVVAQAGESEEATDFFDSIKDSFLVSGLFYLDESERRGTQLANAVFLRAAEAAHRHQTINGEAVNAPWMFYDPNQAPASKEWADNVQVEWFKSGKRVIGTPVKHPNEIVQSSGISVEIDGGFRFNGSIVLAKDFYETSALIGHSQSEIHWRERLRYELAESHATAETLARGSTLFKIHRKPRIPDPPAPKTP